MLPQVRSGLQLFHIIFFSTPSDMDNDLWYFIIQFSPHKNNQTQQNFSKIKKRPFWIMFRNDLIRKVLDPVQA